MSMLRFDHVGVVVDDLDAASAFFVGLGFEREGGTTVEGEAVDKINGLAGVRAEIMMVRTPDGTGKLELVKYHAPADDDGPQPWPEEGPWLEVAGACAPCRLRSWLSSPLSSRAR